MKTVETSAVNTDHTTEGTQDGPGTASSQGSGGTVVDAAGSTNVPGSTNGQTEHAGAAPTVLTASAPTPSRPRHVAGFHPGERAVQALAGLSEEAARLEGMLAPAALGGGAAMFLAMQRFAVLAARDAQGALWASPLTGAAGFLEGEGQTLRIATQPDEDDPLHEVPAGQSAAVITVDLQRRRRVRVNGWLAAVGRDSLTIEVEEAYGNCPSYIQQRAVHPSSATIASGTRAALAEGSTLTDEAANIVAAADTFFVATQHPEVGTDVSHKGGNPGFVRIEGSEIVWPDYAGNNMFNTMGNLMIDKSAGLLFVDFETGSVVQLSGTATLVWGPSTKTEDDTSTGRWVRFRPQHGLVRVSKVHSSTAPVMSPHNPQIATSH